MPKGSPGCRGCDVVLRALPIGAWRRGQRRAASPRRTRLRAFRMRAGRGAGWVPPYVAAGAEPQLPDCRRSWSWGDFTPDATASTDSFPCKMRFIQDVTVPNELLFLHPEQRPSRTELAWTRCDPRPRSPSHPTDYWWVGLLRQLIEQAHLSTPALHKRWPHRS